MMKRIKVGDSLPNSKVMVVDSKGTGEKNLHDILGKRSVIFAVPGAFTPTCAVKHLPSYLAQSDALKNKGIDRIICLAVNDGYVMKAWQEVSKSAGVITMIADGSCALTEQWGLVLDLTKHAMGKRSERYAMVVEGQKITHLWVEGPGEYKVSSAEYVASQL